MPGRLTDYRLVSLIGFLCMMAALFFPLQGLSAPANALSATVSATPSPTPTATPTPQPTRIPVHGNIFTYVSVMDPNIVEDVFGKRISDRFVAIQVTIANKNSEFQFLIHDVSLDLKNVFGKRVSYNLAVEASDRSSCVIDCMRKSILQAEETAESTEAAKNQKTSKSTEDAKMEAANTQAKQILKCRTDCPVASDAPQLRFELSSLELSLIRGVAEKGQAQDRRNKILRYLEGAGTVAASFIGFAGVGPKFSDFMALYNGDFLAAYRHVYPDFTINQMNRLSDSAYKSNTLIPRDQAKVLVAFIPQAMFLTPDQRNKFRKDPTSLYPNYYEENHDTDNTVDFRRAEALVDGNFIVELQNLPVTLTGVQIDPNQALEFLKPQPAVKGYILGQFLEGANISLENPPPGVQVAPDTKATPEEGKLPFVITANALVPDGTPLTFRIFNKQNSQTFSYTVSYTTPVPRLVDKTLTGIAGGPDVPIELPGTNLIDGLTDLVLFRTGDVDSNVKIADKHVETNADGTVSFKATLKMTTANDGAFILKARNGKFDSNSIALNIKPKPKPTPTP